MICRSICIVDLLPGRPHLNFHDFLKNPIVLTLKHLPTVDFVQCSPQSFPYSSMNMSMKQYAYLIYTYTYIASLFGRQNSTDSQTGRVVFWCVLHPKKNHVALLVSRKKSLCMKSTEQLSPSWRCFSSMGMFLYVFGILGGFFVG